PAGTRRVQIVAAEPAQVLERLRQQPGVHQATLFGQAVFALIDDNLTDAELGVPSHDVVPAEPTLEDVFVTLSRARNGDGPAADRPSLQPASKQPDAVLPSPPVRQASRVRTGFSRQRVASVARKEFLHIIRDRSTLFFSLFIPIVELFMLGYAVDMNIRHIPTVVFDQAGTQESRTLLDHFTNSDDFDLVGKVYSDAALNEAIVSGRAHVGLKIPEDFSRQLMAGQTAQLLVLVDGSEASVAAEAVNVSNAIALRESLIHILAGRSLPVETRPEVMFNPDTRSANFFIPGLLVVLCQVMAVMLTSNSIVREREQGTLEQLFMTPVRPRELILGKIVPYLFLTTAEFCVIALLMCSAFQVPVHGVFLTLLGIALPFIVGMLGLGLWISTLATTRDASLQLSMGTVIPSIFLSGYVFPIESMPRIFQWLAYLVPTTWMIDASRGVILRGAGWNELKLNFVVLSGMSLLLVVLSMTRFRKRLA
ncbi:MAG TPA: ABC transporter permease, partial [Pirellulales bacterium]|nr:ABC transporter permease [Pirellulales bacterium]